MEDRSITVLCLVWSKCRERQDDGSWTADFDDDAALAVEEHLMSSGVIDGDGRFTDQAPDTFAEEVMSCV